MLFDSFDPYLTWRQLFRACCSQLQGEKDAPTDALELVAFVIHTFRLSDEEVTKLHAPLVAFALLDLVHKAVDGETENGGDSTANAIPDTLLLATNIAHVLLKETSPSFFSNLTASMARETLVARSAIQVASDFYSAKYNKSAKVPSNGFGLSLVQDGFLTLFDLITKCSTSLSASHPELLLASLQMLEYLTELPPRDQPIALDWKPQEWVEGILKVVDQADATQEGFEHTEAAVQCLIALQDAPVAPNVPLDRRRTIETIINKVQSEPLSAGFSSQAKRLICLLSFSPSYNLIARRSSLRPSA